MYILVTVLTDPNGNLTTQRYAARTKAPLTAIVDTLSGGIRLEARRMTARDGGWESGSDEAWRLINEPYGTAELVY